MSDALTEAWNAGENLRNLLDTDEGSRVILASFRVLVLKQLENYLENYMERYEKLVEEAKEGKINEEYSKWLYNADFIKDLTKEQVARLGVMEVNNYNTVVDEVKTLPDELMQQLLHILAELIVGVGYNRILYYIAEEARYLENIDRIRNKQPIIGAVEIVDYDEIVLDEGEEKTIGSCMIIEQIMSEFELIYKLIDEFQGNIELYMTAEG